MKNVIWKCALLACAAIWGASFVVLKGALDVIAPVQLMTIRFLLATLLLGALFYKRIKSNLTAHMIKRGALMGVFFGLGFAIQNMGLVYTTPGRNAFLTAVYCVLVPFFGWGISKRKPHLSNLLAAILCVAGIGLVSIDRNLSPTLNIGDQLTLVSAVLYALHIAVTARFSKDSDILTLTVIQSFFAFVTCWFVALIKGEPTPDLTLITTPAFLASLAYIVVLSSCVTMVFQNMGTAKVPAAQAALLLSMESVFAVICSVIFYGEALTLRLIAGFAVIFSAILISELGTPAADAPADDALASGTPATSASTAQTPAADAPHESQGELA